MENPSINGWLNWLRGAWKASNHQASCWILWKIRSRFSVTNKTWRDWFTDWWVGRVKNAHPFDKKNMAYTSEATNPFTSLLHQFKIMRGPVLARTVKVHEVYYVVKSFLNLIQSLYIHAMCAQIFFGMTVLTCRLWRDGKKNSASREDVTSISGINTGPLKFIH